jgi:anti-sigma B factor antagonist
MTTGSFSLSGEIDIATVPELRSALSAFVASTTGDVVLDCTDLSFLDCSGVGVLVETRNDLERQARRLDFQNVAGSPHRVLGILGVIPSDPRAQGRDAA